MIFVSTVILSYYLIEKNVFLRFLVVSQLVEKSLGLMYTMMLLRPCKLLLKRLPVPRSPANKVTEAGAGVAVEVEARLQSRLHLT